MSETIPVSLGERSYEIHVAPGLLSRAGELLKPFARGPLPIVADEHVAKLHLQTVVDAARSAGLDPYPIILAPGEGTKSFAGLEQLCGLLLAAGVERGGLIVALGGGVIGDLTGFAAGVLKRGVDFAQLPTTLLADVDSSVGGKTAINTREGKNLIGLFHQPRIVIADTKALDTLPKRELLAGYAEIVKYGALGDAEFFVWLEMNGEKMLGGDEPARIHAVAHSCRMKAAIVMRDERESGERALLNLGHTFGHALEAATGYSDELLHGEAVAVGMALAFRLSAELGLCPADDATRVEAHLRRVGLPASIADVPGPRPSPDLLLEHMSHDKKAAHGRLVLILAHGIGRAFVTNEVPVAAIREILAA
ncbi:MAG TPA: 3-dehydroquinate synthase [Rhizomicrobium sp.]|jgi:3-dehydroquinate synthase|nr:3-dehydroquinate synthase [Rhizomicrobium sp.]